MTKIIQDIANALFFVHSQKLVDNLKTLAIIEQTHQAVDNLKQLAISEQTHHFFGWIWLKNQLPLTKLTSKKIRRFEL